MWTRCWPNLTARPEEVQSHIAIARTQTTLRWPRRQQTAMTPPRGYRPQYCDDTASLLVRPTPMGSSQFTSRNPLKIKQRKPTEVGMCRTLA